ncbi:hypothetical protein CEXT_358851, partial [Caerostris extrusa]
MNLKLEHNHIPPTVTAVDLAAFRCTMHLFYSKMVSTVCRATMAKKETSCVGWDLALHKTGG